MTEVSTKRSSRKTVAPPVEAKPETVSLPIRDPHAVPVVFCNQIVGSGFYAGNVNLTFAVANFTPTALGENAPPIQADLAICSRLRLDMSCAEQLYAELGKIIQQMKPANATTQ